MCEQCEECNGCDHVASATFHIVYNEVPGLG